MSAVEIVRRDLNSPNTTMMLVKLDLPRSIPRQIDQGTNVATMSNKVVTDKALVQALVTANINLQTAQEAAMEARSGAAEATQAVAAAAKVQRVAYGNLAGAVNTQADGDAAFIRSTGYDVRATPTPVPPLTEAPTDLRTRINGVPRQVMMSWKGLFGARVYEVQYTTDLTGATGWTSVSETPGKTRVSIDGLTSGTKYAFRVRALGSGQPGPWSGPVQQMAP